MLLKKKGKFNIQYILILKAKIIVSELYVHGYLCRQTALSFLQQVWINCILFCEG